MNFVSVFIFIFVFVKCTEHEILDALPSAADPLQAVEAILSSVEELALKSISLGAQEFAVQLYSLLAETEGNVVVSPLSLEIVLALAYAGAKGDTASELATLLSLPEIAEETTLSGYSSLIRVVQDPVLCLTSRMYVEESAPVREDYQKIAEEYFFSQAEPLDFVGAPETSREHINSWVEQETNDKITDLLAAGSVSVDTRLVLVNAIYFKSNWKTKFDESETTEQPFLVSSTEQVKVQMMNSMNTFSFLHDDALEAKFLRLDYEGDKFEMIIILPDDSEGLSDLESKLENINVFEILNKSSYTEVDVYLPKFKMEKTVELNDVLKSMGAPTMFTNAADFGGISDEKLAVSSAVQKAFIEVNEEGTEAAAASALSFSTTTSLGSYEPLVETFRADHPFMFLIGLKERQIHVFCGRYVRPDE